MTEQEPTRRTAAAQLRALVAQLAGAAPTAETIRDLLVALEDVRDELRVQLEDQRVAEHKATFGERRGGSKHVPPPPARSTKRR